MKTLMILGGLQEFVPLVALAEKRNIRTVVVDGNVHAPAKQIADRAYDEDIRNTEACSEIAGSEHADAITTGYSDLLLECMVRIADKAGLPCHLRPDQLPYYRNKDIIHQTCRRLGIPMAKSRLLDESFSDDSLSDLRFPLVLKPLDLYGSRGLRVVYSIPEVHQSFRDALSSSALPYVLAEEYNPDPEFNMQCWVRHGKIHVLGIADREKTKFPVSSIPLSTRNVYPSRSFSDVCDPAVQLLDTYIRYTGQTEGPLCMQFFCSPERGIEVGEIAARFLGYEHELIRFSAGLSIEDLLISAAEDDARVDPLLAACRPSGLRHAAVLYLHGKDGIIADQSSLVQASRRKDIEGSQLFYRQGERIGSPQTRPYVARYDITAETRDALDEKTRSILAPLSVTGMNGEELLLKGSVQEVKERKRHD